jgi:hypothetical protein
VRVCAKSVDGKLFPSNTAVTAATAAAATAVAGVGDSGQPVIVPFMTTDPACLGLEAGERVVVSERSDNLLWTYGRSVGSGKQGWFPDYCLKRWTQFFESEAGGEGKLERVVLVRDFVGTREGEVLTVVSGRHAKSGWLLAVSSDGLRLIWVPEKFCKTIADPNLTTSEGAGVSGQSGGGSVWQGGKTGGGGHSSTQVVRRGFVGEAENELTVNVGDVVSVRQAEAESGWTLGVVVANGSKKEGWFPEWCLKEAETKQTDGKCSNCGLECVAVGFVRVPGKNPGEATQGPICSASCWEKWIKRVTVAR